MIVEKPLAPTAAQTEELDVYKRQVLDRLDFMAKSGRCSGVLAFGANLLGIKPALEVIDGELKVVKKYRGSLPICVGKYITDRLVERDDIEALSLIPL